LDEFVQLWNTHIIRRSHSGSGGRPILLYEASNGNGINDFTIPVDVDKLQICADECSPAGNVCSDNDIEELANVYLQEHNLTVESDVYAAVDLYDFLRTTINSDLG
jgi:hypothetical protein